MRRRDFAILLATGPCLGALSLFRAVAQVRRPLIAMLLVGGSENTERRAALAELGWVDGRSIDIVTRYAHGDLDRVPELVAELVALNPDVLLTHTGAAARAAAARTSTIPIVIGAAGEEVMIELAGNLARPTGNLTGLTLVSHEQHAKVLELLKEAQPTAKQVAILTNPLSPGYQDYPAVLSDALNRLGLKALRIEARNQNELEAAFAKIAESRADAVLVTADPNFNRPIMHLTINELARKERIPVVATFDGFTREGGLLSLGTDYGVLYRRAAVYVDKILKGAQPSDLPVERPSVFRLTLNLKTALVLGLTIPPTLLARADEVIE